MLRIMLEPNSQIKEEMIVPRHADITDADGIYVNGTLSFTHHQNI